MIAFGTALFTSESRTNDNRDMLSCLEGQLPARYRTNEKSFDILATERGFF